jgi:hypothetical protein
MARKKIFHITGKTFHASIVYCVTAYPKKNIYDLRTELKILVKHWAQYSFRTTDEVLATVVSA